MSRGRQQKTNAAPRAATVDALLREGSSAHQRGDTQAAERAFRRVLALDPLNLPAAQLLGAILVDGDKIDEALDLFEKVAESLGEPSEATLGFYNNYANALRRADRFPSAEKMLRAIIEIDPRGWHSWHNLGQTLKQMKRLDEAAAALRRAVMLEPTFGPNHGVLGEVLHKQGRLNSAEVSLRKSIELGCMDTTVWALLGNTNRLLGRTAVAIEILTRALAMVPDAPGAHSNLGIALMQHGLLDDGVTHFARAVELDPDVNVWHAHLSYALLMSGQLDTAWEEWEYGILNGPRGAERDTGLPRWSPEATDARVLAYREQGVGDEIIFASCYPDLIASTREVVIECDTRIVPLFARSFPDAEVRAQTMDAYGRETIHDCDHVIPAGSLPPIFRPRLDAFPDRRSYLVPDEARVAEWRERLAEEAGPGPYIGISWRSKVKSAERRLEYTRLEEWEAIFAVPGVAWVNLQYDQCEPELHDAETRFGVRVHRWPWLDLMNDFDEIAALNRALDFVVAPRNAVAMLSGALGVDTAVLCNKFAWLDLGADNCPWVPSLRIIARNPGDDWTDALASAAAAVAEAAQRAASRV